MNQENASATKNLDEIIKQFDANLAKSYWDNEDRSMLKSLRKNLGTPSEIAPKLGVSVATIHYWERQIQSSTPEQCRQSPPPPDKLSILRREVPGQRFDLAASQSGPSPMAPRPSSGFVETRRTSQVLERGKYSSKSWILRSGTPFAVLTDETMFKQMVDYLKNKDQVNVFVYRAPADNEDETDDLFDAKFTFDQVKQKLKAQGDTNNLLDKIIGVPVKRPEDVDLLGLTDPWTSFCVMQYNDEGRLKWGRRVDVWQEFRFQEANPKDPSTIETKDVWLELSKERSQLWYQRRIELLEKLEHETRALS